MAMKLVHICDICLEEEASGDIPNGWLYIEGPQYYLACAYCIGRWLDRWGNLTNAWNGVESL